MSDLPDLSDMSDGSERRCAMRLKRFLGKRREPFTMPAHYNYFLQSLIYRHLDEHLAQQLHDEGIGEGTKRFRYFTFSRLIGNFQRQNKHLTFPRGAILYIASPNNAFLESLVLRLLTRGEIPIGEGCVPLHKIEATPQPEYQPEVILKALSPITLRQPSEKYTYYLEPRDPDFSDRIINNLRDKVRFWYEREIPPVTPIACPMPWTSKRTFTLSTSKVHG